MAEGYSMEIKAEVKGPDDDTMFRMSMEWVGMSYSQLVDLEEVVGHGLIDGPISLGRAMLGGGATRVAGGKK